MKPLQTLLLVLLMIQGVMVFAQEEEPEALPYCIEVFPPDSATIDQDTVYDVYLVFYEKDLKTIKELSIVNKEKEVLFATTDLLADNVKAKEKTKEKSKIKIKNDRLMIKICKADDLCNIVIVGKDKDKKDKVFQKVKSLEAFGEEELSEKEKTITKFNVRMKR